jgi:S-adenosylmethionine hydrolase
MAYYSNYAAAKESELFLIEGSCGTLEISLKNGNANERFPLKAGARIKIS